MTNATSSTTTTRKTARLLNGDRIEFDYEDNAGIWTAGDRFDYLTPWSEVAGFLCWGWNARGRKAEMFIPVDHDHDDE